MAWFQSRSRSKWFFNQRMNFTMRWVSRPMACSMMSVLGWSDLDLAAGPGWRVFARRLYSASLITPLRLRISSFMRVIRLVVGQAEHAGLLGFGGDVAGPGFGFTESVLEFVEYFFDVPTGFVENGDEAWRHRGG